MQIIDAFCGLFKSKPIKLYVSKNDYDTLMTIIKNSMKLCESNDINSKYLYKNLECIKKTIEKSVCNDELDLEKEPIALVDNHPLHFGSGHLSDSVAKLALRESSNDSHSADDSCVQTNIVK